MVFAIIWLTNVLQAVLVHGCMEADVVESTYGVPTLEVNNRKDEKKFIQNLTRCNVLFSKSFFLKKHKNPKYVFFAE